MITSVRFFCIIIATIISHVFANNLHAQKLKSFAVIGVDYRQYPLDIEDVPRGGSSTNGLPSDLRFWRAMSLNTGIGILFKKNYSGLLTFYSRYNHFYWIQGYNEINSISKRKDRKNSKFDVFADVKKKWLVNKNKARFLFATIGIGVSNVNTQYDFYLQDTLISGPGPVQHFTGDFLHFGPKVSFGLQMKKLIVGVNAFVIEGPQRNNLTSLWLGVGIGYEFDLKKVN
jgi:hypothetical protein